MPPAGGQAAAVQQEVQALRTAIEAFRTACQSGHIAAAKAALVQVAEDWKALPQAVKARIENNHPELVERIAAFKAVPREIQALKGAVEVVRADREKGDIAAAKAALHHHDIWSADAGHSGLNPFPRPGRPRIDL